MDSSNLRAYIQNLFPVTSKLDILGIQLLILASFIFILLFILSTSSVILIGLILIVGISTALVILLKPKYGVYLILMTAPFDKFRTYLTQPITFNLKLIHILLFITLISWIFHIFISKNPRIIIDRKLTLLIAFLFFSFIFSVIFAIDPKDAMENLLQRLMLFTIFILVVNYLRNKRDLQIAYWFLLTGALLSVSYGIFQIVGFYSGFDTNITFLESLPQIETYRMGLKVNLGVPRMNAFVNDPNIFGAYLLGILGLTLSLFLTKYQTERKISPIYISSALLLTCAILATLSRSVLLGLGTMSLIIVYYFSRQILKSRIIFLIIIISVVFLLLISFSQLGQSFIDRMLGTNAAGYQSNLAHQKYAVAALEMIRAKPMTGVGLGGYPTYFTNYIDPEARTGMSHSMYLTLLSETGPLSLLAMILIFVYFWTSYGKSIKQTSSSNYLRAHLIGWRAYLPGFAISSIFYSYLSYEFIWCFFGIMTATLLVSRR